MKIALGPDHAGFELKEIIRQHLANRGFELDDRGTNSPDSVDYPDFARLVGEQVASGKADLGILVCGAGIGNIHCGEQGDGNPCGQRAQ